MKTSAQGRAGAMFRPDDLALMAHDDSEEPMAVKVKSIGYDVRLLRTPPSCKADDWQTSNSNGRYLGITGQILEWVPKDSEGKYQRTWKDVRVYKFKGVRKLSSLACSPLPDVMRDRLTARGRLYTQLTGVHYKSYEGSLITVSFGAMGGKQIDKRRADGRAMIDRASYKRMQPSAYGNSKVGGFLGDDELDFDDCDCELCTGRVTENLVDEDSLHAGTVKRAKQVPEKDLVLLPPVVFGFAFSLKSWGMMLVNGFSDVVFAENAFEHLVLDVTNKVCPLLPLAFYQY